MGWIKLTTEEDVELLIEHVDGFHDWYVAGFSYDPLAQSEDDNLNLARFKADTDALTITFRWDAKTKRGTWQEVQVEFRHLHVFNFSNYNDPRSLVGLRHREDKRRLLGFRRRRLRRPQRGGAPASGANRLKPPRHLRRDKVEG